MMLIGLGKHAGAKIYHRAILDYSFEEIIHAVADVVLKKCKVVAGLGIVENAFDETALIAGVAPENFYEREKELLVIAKEWMPRLPFREIGLLIIDEIGKNISGSGMDTNVVGRKYTDHAATNRDDIAVKRIFIRGLTHETHGNACGIGLAEFTNQRTVDSVDMNVTRINALTGGHPTAAMLPVAFETDREVLAAALDSLGLVDPEDARVVHISNTLHVREILASEALLSEIEERAELEVLEGPFDAAGNLLPVAAAGTAVAAH
jgi:hypothetical protein